MCQSGYDAVLETDVGFSLEDGRTKWDDCKKKEKHERFIDADKFCLNDIPEEFRSEILADAITSWSKLVVKIVGNYISEDRPESHGALHRYRGLYRRHHGSGYIDWCYPRTSNTTGETPGMMASERSKTDSPDTSSHPDQYNALVVAASHVLFDKDELDHSKVFLEVSGKEFVLKPTSFKLGNKINDRCLFFCRVDESMINEIKNAVQGKWEKMMKVQEQYKMNHQSMSNDTNGTAHDERSDGQESTTTDQDSPEPTINPTLQIPPKLVVHIGYPHEYKKTISLGRVTLVDSDSTGRLFYQHDAQTCPGSSGGLTWVVGASSPGTNWCYHAAPHHGCLVEEGEEVAALTGAIKCD